MTKLSLYDLEQLARLAFKIGCVEEQLKSTKPEPVKNTSVNLDQVLAQHVRTLYEADIKVKRLESMGTLNTLLSMRSTFPEETKNRIPRLIDDFLIKVKNQCVQYDLLLRKP